MERSLGKLAVLALGSKRDMDANAANGRNCAKHQKRQVFRDFATADGATAEMRLMKAKSRLSRIVLLTVSLLCFLAAVGLAQSTDKELQQKETELEKQKIELERKSLELRRKELDLEKMRQDLQVQESAQSLSMNLSGDVLFDYDKAALKPAAEEALKKVSVVLSQFPESKVTVGGYTDAKGGTSVNLQLSKERATSVKDWLVKNGGVAAGNIFAKGLGEDAPVAPNTTADGADDPVGRAQNRRVTIIVEKPAAPAP